MTQPAVPHAPLNKPKVPPYKLAGLILALVTMMVFALTWMQFRGTFEKKTQLTVLSGRAGLSMDPGSKVTFNGVPIGRLASIDVVTVDDNPEAKLILDVKPQYLKLIPENVSAELRATTVFGNKYISFLSPPNPSTERLSPSTPIRAQGVTTEFNTLFETITAISEQIDPIKVDFRVPELFLPTVVQGQRITVGIDAFPGQSFAGEVKALNPLIDASGRAIVVRAEVGNEEGKLRPGLFARVHLQLAERENALFVPEQAVQPQGERAFVFKVVDPGDGKAVARLTPVTLGNRRQGEVEVREGLAPNDLVVTAGQLKIRDGVPVQVTASPVAADKPPAG